MTGGVPGDGSAATGLVAASAQAWSAPGGDTGVLVLHGFTGNRQPHVHAAAGPAPG